MRSAGVAGGDRAQADVPRDVTDFIWNRRAITRKTEQQWVLLRRVHAGDPGTRHRSTKHTWFSTGLCGVDLEHFANR